MKLLKEYFPLPLIIVGALLADASRAFDQEILSLQIMAWTLVVVGVIGLARIVWKKVR